jgi:hypothetical protein
VEDLRDAHTLLIPLRDAFAALFFVSLGTLVSLVLLLHSLSLLGVMLLLIVVGKFVVWAAVVWIFRYPLKTAITVAAGLTQIGELSFVVAQVARSSGFVPEEFLNATIAASLISILLNAFFVRGVIAWQGRQPSERADAEPSQDAAIVPVQARDARRSLMKTLIGLTFALSLFALAGHAQELAAPSEPALGGPELLRFDELVALSSTAKPTGPLGSKLRELLTTPFVSNDATGPLQAGLDFRQASDPGAAPGGAMLPLRSVLCEDHANPERIGRRSHFRSRANDRRFNSRQSGPGITLPLSMFANGLGVKWL